MKNNRAIVSERIRALLAEKGLSKIDLAKKADVSYRTIFSAVHGQGNLRERIVGRIATALDTSPEYLLTGRGERKMVKDLSPSWGADKEDKEITLKDAILKISKELNVPPKVVTDCFSELAGRAIINDGG